jgi:ribA/ribD-fused uncharacterized protein
MITSFRGQYRYLSNFFPAPVMYDGVAYFSVEHAYQAAKTLDRAWRRTIAKAPTAAEAKETGRKAPLRTDWFHIRLQVMEDLLRQKFQNQELRSKLFDTGDEELIEGNTWADHFWGAVFENGRWRGDNHLGKILMQIRYELQYPHHYPPAAQGQVLAPEVHEPCAFYSGRACEERQAGCTWCPWQFGE